MIQSKWGKPNCSIDVRIHVAKEATSVGDFMRSLDGQSLIKSDFILCSATFVSNMNLTEILKQHHLRKKRDKNQIMTLILKEADPKHHLQSSTEQQTVFFTSNHENRILHVDSFPKFPAKKKIDVPKEIFKSSVEVNVLANLIDTSISICSLDVLALFSENFDYQTIIGDFVKGICTSDLLNSTIYAEIIDSGVHGKGCYAAGISGTRSYAQVAFDIINRWTYPISPDLFPTGPNKNYYNYNRNNVYLGNNIVLARTCTVGPRSMVGHNSKLEANIIFRDSVCGDSAFIDSNSNIFDSHLFQSVKIGKNCNISSTIIGSNVTILDNVTLENGCIIGDNVIIGPNVRVPKFTRIFLPGLNNDGSERSNQLNSSNKPTLNSKGYDSSFVGSDGVGCMWVNENDEEDWESEVADPRCELLDHIGFKISDLQLEHEEAHDDFQSDSDYSTGSGSDSDSDGSMNGFESEGYYEKAQKTLDIKKQSDFKNELAATIKRAFEENHSVATAALELNTLRMAYDGNLELMRRVIIESVIGQIDVHKHYSESSSAEGAKNMGARVKTLLQKWSVLISKNIYSVADQGDSIGIVFEYLIDLPDSLPNKDSAKYDEKFHLFLSKLFLAIIRFLYEFDVLEEDSIINWHSNKTDEDDDDDDEDIKPALSEIEKTLVSGLDKFVEWLDEDENDDSDDDEDEDDESD
ncbi:putative translation initiation factor eIF-2B subunit epsilon [Smittium culicis]|uniref:Translation initiation factor eIF2B subunit epsilon n=1 Tax=Smittium culicis TaxID=133412 RepID=A0A1R1YT44_9FUNG|nr:putative translation initiation factor eIF-2B subunit epsilon [Smittium culicis]